MKSKFKQHLIQAGCILFSLIVAFFLLRGGSSQEPDHTPAASFDMLGFLDDQISSQEDAQDVRSWGSVNKLQMFVAGAAIEQDAVGVRISSYHKLLDDIWVAASKDVESDEVSDARLKEVLEAMFPNSQDEQTDAIRFEFAGESESVLVLQDLITEYSDTVEPWRILQSWASKKVNAEGNLELAPVFSKSAIRSFHTFLVSLDIALLKRAKSIAFKKKRSRIDSDSMAMAFELN